ncbi:TPA: DUF4194 domain-containing protein [Candidatus Avacholeplasma faecigallinarum]|nr:DUF4194 domain-containing protein [Candidatus Avacholeplasma faecigallinarum]
MLEALEKMTITQQNQFKDAVNKLLASTFLSRDKRDNKESYYFLMSYKEVFDEFFKILGYDVILDMPTGSVMLVGASAQNTLKLKRDESIVLLILRLLYHEKMKDTSLNENIVCQVSDIHEKYDYLEIKKKLNKTDLINSLRLFRRYNLIEVTGDLTSSACRIVILPTILMAIKSEDITEVYNTIMKISQEEVK